MSSMQKTTGPNHEKGNVLFLILIAVALFAALSYAVTQSSRSGGGDASSETTLVNSAQLTQYPASVRTSIIRMMVSRSIDPTTLEFDPPSDFGGSSATYGVFHPSGGAATYVLGPAEVMASGTQGTWLFNSAYRIQNIGTTPGDNTGADIVAFLPGVSLGVCKKLNSELGIVETNDTDNNDVPDAGPVIANIPTAAMNMDAGNTGIEVYAAAKLITNDFTGQPFGCADFDDVTAGTANGDLVYYHVLVER
jgi:hypothetical protein